MKTQTLVVMILLSSLQSGFSQINVPESNCLADHGQLFFIDEACLDNESTEEDLIIEFNGYSTSISNNSSDEIYIEVITDPYLGFQEDKFPCVEYIESYSLLAGETLELPGLVTIVNYIKS